MVQRARKYIFLRDVLWLGLTTFGGAQVHMGHFEKTLVEKRKYLSSKDLLELYSLCQVLPGPTSTQTLTAVGYRVGGARLAYLTLLIWMFPSFLAMTFLAILFAAVEDKSWSLEFTRFIQPMAVGFVCYGAYIFSIKTIHTRSGVALLLLSGILSYFVQSPYMIPGILLFSGFATAFKYKNQPRQEKGRIVVPWANFILWGGVLFGAAVLGHFTRSLPGALPVRLFENFYRNGSLVFGGGQALTPLLYTEFVQFAPKKYLSSEEFLSGFAIAQTLPGPVFSFSAFVGGLSMREAGIGGQVMGAAMATAGIFLPGTFLIFFVIRIWEGLKRYRVVRASIEGLTAASAGLVVSASIIMFQPLENTMLNFFLTGLTFTILAFTRIPSPWIIVGGLLLGFLL